MHCVGQRWISPARPLAAVASDSVSCCHVPAIPRTYALTTARNAETSAIELRCGRDRCGATRILSVSSGRGRHTRFRRCWRYLRGCHRPDPLATTRTKISNCVGRRDDSRSCRRNAQSIAISARWRNPAPPSRRLSPGPKAIPGPGDVANFMPDLDSLP